MCCVITSSHSQFGFIFLLQSIHTMHSVDLNVILRVCQPVCKSFLPSRRDQEIWTQCFVPRVAGFEIKIRMQPHANDDPRLSDMMIVGRKIASCWISRAVLFPHSVFWWDFLLFSARKGIRSGFWLKLSSLLLCPFFAELNDAYYNTWRNKTLAVFLSLQELPE